MYAMTTSLSGSTHKLLPAESESRPILTTSYSGVVSDRSPNALTVRGLASSVQTSSRKVQPLSGDRVRDVARSAASHGPLSGPFDFLDRAEADVTIGRATGVLMQVRGCTAAEAAGAMDRCARRNGAPLLVVAILIIATHDLPAEPVAA